MNTFGESIMVRYNNLFKDNLEPPHLIIIKNKAIKFYEKELEKPKKKWFGWGFFNDENEKINLLDKIFNSKPNTKLLTLRKPSYPDCDVEFIYFGNNMKYEILKNVPVDLNTPTNEMSEIQINLTKEKKPDIHYKFSVNEEGELVEFN